MNVIFANPLLFIASLAVPALVLIYLLRNRFREHIVSSLMLWQDHKKARQGGLNISRLQTPLLFILELLAIILLTIAAAGPLIRSNKDTRVFVIVLDNSFSMLVNDGSTPRDRAKEEIINLLTKSGTFQARFILAGKTPQLIGQPVNTIAQTNDILKRWKCLAPIADLGQAVTLAAEVAGKNARLLVVTDHSPDSIAQKGRLEWWAFGKPLSNMAFVNANRKTFSDRDRCFFAIANLSDKPNSAKLIAKSTIDDRIILDQTVDLSPNQVYRTFFELNDTSGPLIAYLDNDNLNMDNRIILLPQPFKDLRIQIDIKDEKLKTYVTKALASATATTLTSVAPQLLITDNIPPATAVPDLWTLRIISEPNVPAYLGPFVTDRSHPLTEGLSLDGVIWAAPKSAGFTGSHVITAGNIPLITDTQSSIAQHNIKLYLNHNISTLLQSANWPILFYNLIQWRKSSLPGLDRSNIMLGSAVTLTTDSPENNIILTDSQKNSTDISALTKSVLIVPDTHGLYTLKTRNSEHNIAVNAISKTESDLTKATTGTWGQWSQADLYWWEYRPIDWSVLLVVLLLLFTHQFITYSSQKGTLS